MPIPPPDWALRKAGAGDRKAALAARETGVLQIAWGDQKALKQWAKQQGWPTSWWDFQGTFLEVMLESDAHFALALSESGIALRVPKERHALTAKQFATMDEEYEGRQFRWLVEGLREIRRAVEVGVVIEVEDKELKSWNDWYTWAHGRYYLLEDDINTAWIGDDSRHPNW